jgi:hypothetical protein
MTVADPNTFTRAWTISTELRLQADTELLEFVCNENEQDRQLVVYAVEGDFTGHRRASTSQR